MNAWPLASLGGALLVSLSWGASQHATATSLRSQLAAEDLRAHRLELDVQRLTESVDSLQDEWHTLNVVHHAIDLGLPIPSAANEPTKVAARPLETQSPMGVTSAQAPLPAFLNINSLPPSTCILDGRLLGDTPQHVQVSPGRHVVQFATKDASASTTVAVAAGETRSATAKLPRATVETAVPEGF